MRNSIGGVVQFVYGDDGLDPANLEDETAPVEFVRTWSHAKVSRSLLHPFFATIDTNSQALKHVKGAEGLLPFEITKLVKSTLESRRFVDTCPHQFLEKVTDFVKEMIVIPAAIYREYYGHHAASEPLKSRQDPYFNADRQSCLSSILLSEADQASYAEDQRAIVNNKTKVTKAQIVEFLNLCWTKYSRAKVEPGQSLTHSLQDTV